MLPAPAVAAGGGNASWLRWRSDHALVVWRPAGAGGPRGGLSAEAWAASPAARVQPSRAADGLAVPVQPGRPLDAAVSGLVLLARTRRAAAALAAQPPRAGFHAVCLRRGEDDSNEAAWLMQRLANSGVRCAELGGAPSPAGRLHLLRLQVVADRAASVLAALTPLANGDARALAAALSAAGSPVLGWSGDYGADAAIAAALGGARGIHLARTALQLPLDTLPWLADGRSDDSSDAVLSPAKGEDAEWLRGDNDGGAATAGWLAAPPPARFGRLLRRCELFSGRAAAAAASADVVAASTTAFCGLTLAAAPGGLRPRRSSACLVDALLDALPSLIRPASSQQEINTASLAVLDLGCGSGALLLALLAQCGRSSVRGVGLDVHSPSLAAAAVNAESAGLAAHAAWLQADWAALGELAVASALRRAAVGSTAQNGAMASAFSGFSAVLCNPPYLRGGGCDDVADASRRLPPASRRRPTDEHPGALFGGGADGLAAVRSLAAGLAAARAAPCAPLFADGALMALQLAPHQLQDAARLLHAAGWRALESPVVDAGRVRGLLLRYDAG